MKDNFDLKKYLVENKTIEKYNPFTTENTEKQPLNEDARTDAEEEGYLDGMKDEKYDLRNKIREMVIAELEDYQDYDEEEVDMGMENPVDMLDDVISAEELEEAKEEEEETEEETTEEETEETTEEETTEEEPAAEEGGGIEDIAADMEGTEGELMDHLMSALKVAKGMDNEKLSTQIGNTLKFFVSEYIGGEE